VKVRTRHDGKLDCEGKRDVGRICSCECLEVWHTLNRLCARALDEKIVSRKVKSVFRY
jgi:hypothetical protein